MNLSGLLVAVVGFSSGTVPHFDSEILPVLTRAGCNTGACHGAALGRGGFRLSLLGGDPAADHEAIVYELEGRRINFVHPEESLLLAKPTGELAHKGGLRIEPGSDSAQRLVQWIAAGAPRGQLRKLIHFEVQPEARVIEKVGSTVPLRAMARFDHGKIEDVTPWTVFTASDPSAIEIDDRDTATIRRRGQHVVLARFLDRIVPIRLTVPLTETPVDLSREPRSNFIDDEIYRTLEVLRVPVSPRADDVAFLRRVRLDLTGRLPSPEEVETFLDERSPSKRARLIDRLLASEEFVEYWTYRYAQWLRLRTLPAEAEATWAFHGWIRQQVQQRTGVDRLARTLLTAVGDSHREGPANFARLAADARGQAELVGSVFLGVRFQCANCHNHPLDRWTQDDYHGLAAVFARLERGRTVRVGARGAVTNPRTGEPALPRIPGSEYLQADRDQRKHFADWLTARDNPFFARAMVNRLWKAMFGRGLVEPEDDLRDTNPATHPALLNRLAADFVEHGYDIQHTLRLIARSETYGRAATTTPANATDDRFYSHAYRRSLPPEVLADALADVTDVADRYGDLPLGTRAVALVDPRTPAPALDILGRCGREIGCDAASRGGGLAAKLHQLNGELINRKVADPNGRLHRWIRAGKSNDDIIESFYRLALSRRPTDAERKHWRTQLDGATAASRVELLEDFLWALLNSSDFLMNH